MKTKKIILMLIAIIGTVITTADAQVATLLKDINPNGSSNPRDYVPFLGYTLFVAHDEINEGLWITDGTESGTSLVKDVDALGNQLTYNLYESVELNGKLYFQGGSYSDNIGIEIYETDGTLNGTHLFLDAVPGLVSSNPANFSRFGNNFLFVTDEVGGGQALWITGGTEATTQIIASSLNTINIASQFTFEGEIYFMKSVFGDNELWKTNGTLAGTVQVTGSFVHVFSIDLIFNGSLYFTAYDPINYRELWRINSGGTAQRLSNFDDLAQNNVGPNGDYTILNSKLYFRATDATYGSELFVTDGISLPLLVADLYPGLSGSDPEELVSFNNKLYFVAATSNFSGDALFEYDPSTNLVTEIVLPLNTHDPRKLTLFDNKLFFSLTYNYNNYLYYLDAANLPELVFIDNFSTLEVSYGSLTVSNEIFYIKGYNQANTSDAEPFAMQSENSPIISWKGSMSSSWFNKNNWQPKQIPTESNNVSIPLNCPNYPFLTSGTAKCKNMTIANGASFSMTGGTIKVYGKISATDAFAFSLGGGTMKLYYGSNFPADMIFNNLTVTSLNNTLEENQYTFPGNVNFHGNLVVTGSATGDAFRLPEITMTANNNFNLLKDLTVNQGEIGLFFPTLTDNTTMPSISFNGTIQQRVNINNYSELVDGASLFCNLIMNNPAIKIVNPGRDIVLNNLIVNQNFDLSGNSIHLLGRIIYNAPNVSILNTKANQGKLYIENSAQYNFNNGACSLNVSKLRTVEFYSHNSGGPIDTLELFNYLTVDTLKANCYLNMSGRNLTIGGTTKGTGYLDCTIMGNEFPVGTLSLLGNNSCPRYKLVADQLNNLTLNNPAGAELNNLNELEITHPSYGRMNLYGTAKLNNGNFDLKQSQIFLEPSSYYINYGGQIFERPGHTFINSVNDPGGQTFFIVKDTVVNTVCSNLNIGKLGFIISCNNPLNAITVLRTPINFTGLNGGTSINRVYTISNPGAGINLNAQIKLKYDDNELQGVNESDLAIFRRSDNEPNDVWHLVPSTVNTTSNTVTSSGLSQIDYSTTGALGYTYYTLASASTPLKNSNTFNQESISNSNKVLAFPNPFTQKLNAQFISEVNESATIQLIDLTGKQLSEQQVQLVKGNNDISICCIDEIPNGIYFLRITSSQTNNIVKVVKQ